MIREAAGILAADLATLHRVARGELAHEPEMMVKVPWERRGQAGRAAAAAALEAVAKAVAADGMIASRRLLAAAQALTRARARAVFCDCGHEDEVHVRREGRCEVDKCACERFTLER